MGFWGQHEKFASLQLDSCQHLCLSAAFLQSHRWVDHDRYCCADCRNRGRTLLSCPCSICHLLVAIYTALIAVVGWARGNGNALESLWSGELKKERYCWFFNVLDWAWEGIATCHHTGTAPQALCLCRPTAFQWRSESLKNHSLIGKMQIPSGLSSRALIAACFIQPVSPVLTVVLYVFSIFKAWFSLQCFLWHFHPKIFFFCASSFQ